VDNASANNVAISYLVRGLSVWNDHTLLNGEFMHMRCSAHILNLIVSDGLKEIDSSISKVRVVCKSVRSSPSRLTTFKSCTEEFSVNSKAMLTLGVPTRWKSTYLMLDVAEKFEQASYCFEYVEAAYVLNLLTSEGGYPKDVDWKRARVFVSFF